MLFDWKGKKVYKMRNGLAYKNQWVNLLLNFKIGSAPVMTVPLNRLQKLDKDKHSSLLFKEYKFHKNRVCFYNQRGQRWVVSILFIMFNDFRKIHCLTRLKQGFM